MSETAAILHNATRRSLVLLDEIGRGTSTYDGVAIAWSVAEFLHEAVGCKTIFATHYHELTQLADRSPASSHERRGARIGRRDVFLHRLKPGGADPLVRIHVARLAGLPAPSSSGAGSAALLRNRPSRARAPPGPDQLALFAGGEHPALAELKALDLDGLSPRRGAGPARRAPGEGEGERR